MLLEIIIDNILINFQPSPAYVTCNFIQQFTYTFCVRGSMC